MGNTAAAGMGVSRGLSLGSFCVSASLVVRILRLAIYSFALNYVRKLRLDQYVTIFYYLQVSPAMGDEWKGSQPTRTAQAPLPRIVRILVPTNYDWRERQYISLKHV